MILGGRNADFAKVLEIIGNALGRIVGEKGITQTKLAKEGEEGAGGFKKGVTTVNGAVHVEGDMADGAESFFHL